MPALIACITAVEIELSDVAASIPGASGEQLTALQLLQAELEHQRDIFRAVVPADAVPSVA